MDWNSIASTAQQQGAIFWVAAAAVALGVTLLVVAVGQALLRAGRRTIVPTPAEEPEPAPATAGPTTVEVASSDARAVENDRDTYQVVAEDHSLALLLRRLQQAGDRLEEMAQDLDVQPALDPGSSLKSEPELVEYVFRASGS